MTTKTVTHGSGVATATTTTSQAHTIGSIGDLVVIGIQFENDSSDAVDAATPITNTGSAITWTKILDTSPTVSSTRVVTRFYAGYAASSGSITFTHNKTTSSSNNRNMSVWAFNGVTGTLATDIPSGNRFVDTTNGGTNVSQSITPAAAGSHIIGGIGDWNQTNSFSALTDNTIVHTANVGGAYTGVWVEPTTNPLTTGSAFTWGANSTSSDTTWAVFEVVAAASTWDANYDVGGTLSGGNLTFTDTGGAPGDGVPSTTGYSSGKYAFSVAVDGGFSAFESFVGVTSDKTDLSIATTASYGLAYNSGAYYIVSNGGVVAGPDSSSPAPTGTDIIKVLLDATGSRLYFQVNGNNVLGGNPAAGTGGHTIGAGTYYGLLATFASGRAGTVDFTPGSNPSGFNDWDSVAGGGPAAYTITADSGSYAITGSAVTTQIAPYWTYVGKTEAAVNASGNYTLTEPTGAQQNDILVVDFAIRSTVIYTNAAWIFPQDDSGGNTTNNTTGSDVSYQTGYCIRGASAPTLVFSRTGGSRALGTMRCYRSSKTGTPTFDTSAEVAMGAAGTGITLSGGVTTAAVGELLVTGVYGARANTTSNMDGTTEVTGNSGATDITTPPVRGTWTERSDRNNGTSPTVGLSCYDAVKISAGSTGNLTATRSSSALHGMTVMAFKHPAGGAFSITADAGSYTITGTAVTTKRGRKVAADSGSYAITGTAVTTRKGWVVSALSGSYAITGTAVTLRQTRLVTAASGSYSITGTDVTLTKTAAKSVVADAGSYAITGTAVNFRKTHLVSANTGNYSITGTAVTLTLLANKRVVADAGNYNITGTAVTLRQTRLITAAAGSYVITGTAVNLNVGKKVSALSGSYAITGTAVTFLQSRNVVASTGNYSLTGSNVTLTYTPVTPPATADSPLVSGFKFGSLMVHTPYGEASEEPPVEGFDWPDETNTGYRTSLTAYDGPSTITTPGTLIEGKSITGTLTIAADDVTIRDCSFTSFGLWGLLRDGTAENTVVEYCTFDAAGAVNTSAIGIGGGSSIIRYCDISGVTLGIQLQGSCHVYRNYIHNLWSTSVDIDDRHFDGVTVFAAAPGTVIEYNSIDMPDPDGGTACVFIATRFLTGIDDVTVYHNKMTGFPSYMSYTEDTGLGVTNIALTSNLMDRGGFGWYSVVGTTISASGNYDPEMGVFPGLQSPVVIQIPGSDTLTSAFTPSATLNTNDNNGVISLRHVITLDEAVPGPFRVAYLACGNDNTLVSHVSVGVSAGSGNTVDTPVELTFGGSVGLPTDSEAGRSYIALSDPVDLGSLADGSDIVVIVDHTGAGQSFGGGNTNITTYFKASTATYNQASPGGLTHSSGNNFGVYGIYQ